IEKTASEATQSSTTFQAFQQGIEIPLIQGLKQTIGNNQEIGPSAGLQEMLTKARHLAWEDMASDVHSFRELLTPEDRAQFLRDKVNFSSLNKPAVEIWLDEIAQTDTDDLTITNCPALSTDLFRPRQTLLRQLQKLTLTNCKNVDGDELISLLAQHSPALQLLDLSETPLQHFDEVYRYASGMKSWLFNRRQAITFPSLLYLRLNQCSTLQTLALEAPLKRLEVKGCPLLKSIKLQGEELNLTRLAVEGVTQLPRDWINQQIQERVTVTLDKYTAKGAYASILQHIPTYPSKKIQELRINGSHQNLRAFDLRSISLLPFLTSLEFHDNYMEEVNEGTPLLPVRNSLP
ncbi:MAG: hypothetical protein U1A05_00205, partial [Alphaproteobacteria bacterium]|nr:hypothetical protein [Alphaproteobacteria bacterium]